MGSLNGTFLNSQAVHHHLSESRHWGNPVDLSNGDTIALGTSSKIFVSGHDFVWNLYFVCCFIMKSNLEFILLN